MDGDISLFVSFSLSTSLSPATTFLLSPHLYLLSLSMCVYVRIQCYIDMGSTKKNINGVLAKKKRKIELEFKCV